MSTAPAAAPEVPLDRPRRTALGVLGPTWRASRFVLVRTFADPVRGGRLRDDGWPPGLRALVGAAVAVYGVLMLAAVFAPAVRSHDQLLFVPPDTTMPRLAVPLLGTGLVLALACLQSGVLHVRVPIRIAGTAVVAAILLNQIDWSDLGAADLVSVAFTALLPLLVLARVRRRFHWLEPVVALVAVGGAVVAYQGFSLTTLADTSPGLRISRLDTLLLPVWGLAAPVSILAGAALVEITTVATTWSVATAWDVVGHRPGARRWTTTLLLALVAGRTVQETLRFADPTALVGTKGLLVAAALVAVAFVLGAVVTTLADRTGAGDVRRPPDPDDVVAAWRGSAPYLALALAAGIGLQSLVEVLLHAVGLTRAGLVVRRFGGDTSVLVSALLVTGAALVTSLVLARRGWGRTGLVLVTFATMFGAQAAFSATNLVTTTDDLLTVVSGVAVVLLVVQALRRRLDAGTEVALAGVLALGIAYTFRDWFTEPLTQLASLTGVGAALLVGLIWRLLTDNAYAGGDSPGFPRASRVLLVLANALVGLVFAALLALRGGAYTLDLRQAESIGDTIVGFPLVLAVMFSGLSLAVRGRGRSEVTSAGTAARTA